MTHAQRLRKIADRVHTGAIGRLADAEAIRLIAAELEALDVFTLDIDPVRDHPELGVQWMQIEIRWIKAYAQKAVQAALDARVPMTDEHE